MTRKRPILSRALLPLTTILLITLPVFLSAQMLTFTSKSSAAAENFRLGVQTFQRGLINESILSLEKALTNSPEDPLILYWLSRAYERSGFETTALTNLQQIEKGGNKLPFISARIESLQARASGEILDPLATRFIDTGSITNRAAGERIFFRPSWVQPNADGSFWLCSFGSDEIIRLDINGILRERYRGPAGGLDRPFCLLTDAAGRFLVSEYGADRVTVLAPSGKFIKSFGAHGRGDGQLIGPQYLCFDDSGYIYVSEYGNRRISKFDADGNFVLSFGSTQDGFEGLSAPTGILYMDGKLFVADSFKKTIFCFDQDGNYLSAFTDDKISRPEGLCRYDDSHIVFTDSGRVYSLDLEDETVSLLYESINKKNKLLCAMPDANGNLIVPDFNNSLVSLVSPPSLVYAGLSVDILRVNADRFPIVDMEARIRDKRGMGLTGLARRNFYLTEQTTSSQKRIEGEQTVDYLVKTILPNQTIEVISDTGLDSTMDSVALFDGSSDLRDDLNSAPEILGQTLKSIAAAGNLSAVYSGTKPTASQDTSAQAILNAYRGQKPQAQWRFDLGLRLAASKLIVAGARRSVFFFTHGQVRNDDFATYSLSELASYLKNNAISLIVITTNEAKTDPSLSFLARQSGGDVYSLFRAEGIGAVIAKRKSEATGIYYLRFQSQGDSDFGTRYLPFALEVYLMKKSGRDEFGFFAPLH
jgi:DNA-binding beta-propeller fold protein YncE